MKLKEEDIKDISGVQEFFNRTQKALDVFAEQDEKNSYMLICVEKVNVDGEERTLSHIALGGSKGTLERAIYQAMYEDKDFKDTVLSSVGRYSMERVLDRHTRKEGKK